MIHSDKSECTQQDIEGACECMRARMFLFAFVFVHVCLVMAGNAASHRNNINTQHMKCNIRHSLASFFLTRAILMLCGKALVCLVLGDIFVLIHLHCE